MAMASVGNGGPKVSPTRASMAMASVGNGGPKVSPWPVKVSGSAKVKEVSASRINGGNLCNCVTSGPLQQKIAQELERVKQMDEFASSDRIDIARIRRF